MLTLVITLFFSLCLVTLSVKTGLGSILGFLLCGIIVGPTGLGLLENTHHIHYLAEFGIIFLLFLIGTEMKLPRLWVMRHKIAVFGVAQFIVTGLVLAGLLDYFFDYNTKICLVVGYAAALSSTAMGFQLMAERKILNKPQGQAGFSILLLQDIVVVPFIAILPLLAESKATQNTNLVSAIALQLLLLVVFIVAIRFIVEPFFRLASSVGRNDVFNMAALFFVLACAYGFYASGFSLSLGAFIAGMMIADSGFRYQVIADIEPFKNLLLGLFFIVVGMMFNLDYLLDHPKMVLATTAGLLAAKGLVLYIIGRLNKLDNAQSLQKAVLLSQGGEFCFILFTLAASHNMLTADQSSFFTLVVALSMFVTPLLLNLTGFLVDKTNLEQTTSPQQPEENTAEAQESAEHDDTPEVAIIGFGTLGHMLAEILTASNVAFVALDNDIQTVKEARKQGFNVYYGNITNPSFIRPAYGENIKLMIVTTHDYSVTRQITDFLVGRFPDKELLVRTRYLHQAKEIRAAGVKLVVVEEVQSACKIGDRALEAVGIGPAFRDRHIKSFHSGIVKTLGGTMVEDPIKKTQTKKPPASPADATKRPQPSRIGLGSYGRKNKG